MTTCPPTNPVGPSPSCSRTGRNVTADEDRALAFAFYCRPYVRPQFNHSVALRPEVQAELTPVQRYRLGVDLWQNVTYGRA